MAPKGQCVKMLASRVVLLGMGGTFMEWGPVAGPQFTGDFKVTVRAQPLLVLLVP